MKKRGMYVIGLSVLLLGVMLTSYGVWTQSSFSHGDPSLDQGCYCHNNGIAIFVNGTGDGNGGVFFGSITAGSSFQLLISTNDNAATGVVPGLQLWESNQTDNSKFTFSPTQVTTNSPQNLSPKAGNITALYKITAPSTAGVYTLTFYAQGSLMQPIAIQVAGASTSTTTTQSTTSTTTTTHTTTTSTTTTSMTSTSTTTSKSTTTSTSTSQSTTSTTATTTSVSTTQSITTTPTAGTISFTSPSPGKSFVGTQSYTISGTISPTPSSSDKVLIEVKLQGSSSVFDASTQSVTASGTFSYTTIAGGPLWVTGTFVITATDSNGATGTTTFAYSASGASTSSTSTTSSTITTPSVSTTTTSSTAQTSTQTVSTTAPTTVTTTVAASTLTGPTTTVTGPASTVTSTATMTQTATSTLTQTSSTTPGWAYGAMVVLLLIGLAIGYAVKRPPTKES